MKKITLLVLAIAMFAGMKAQGVQEITTQFGEFTVTAYTVTLKQDKDLVNNAVQQRLKDSELKTGKENGYIAVLNQTFTEIYAQPIDFYAKVDEQGKKKNRVTVVTFFAKSPNLTISQNELNLNVQRFAESFSRYVDNYEAKQNLAAEEKNLSKAQKEQSKAAAAVESIDKSIASDNEKIAKKQAEIEKLQKKIESLKNDIEKLNSSIEKKQDKKSDAQENLKKANDAVQSTENDVERYRQEAN